MVFIPDQFHVSFRILYGDFHGHARKKKFQVLGFDVSLWYRKCCFREETSRCQPVIKAPRRRF